MANFADFVDDTKLTIQTFDDSEERRRKGTPRGELAQIFLYDAEKINNLQAEGAGVFFTVNPQAEHGKRGTDNTTSFARLALDLDITKESQGATNEDRSSKKKELFEKVKNLPIPPNKVFITKNGAQPLWEFSDPRELRTIEERRAANEQYKSLVLGICKVLGHSSEGDSIARVIRLPGTLHLKSPNDPYKIEYQKLNKIKPAFREFLEAYPPIPQKNNSNNSSLVSLEESVRVSEGERHIKMQRLAVSLLSRRYNPKEVWDTMVLINQTYRDKEGNPSPLDSPDMQRIFTDACSYIGRDSSLNSQSLKWPDPPAEEAFSGLAGEIVRTIEPDSEVDPTAILLNFLIAFGSVIGSRPHFIVGATRHGMNEFGIIVGKTSKARKGTAWDYIERIFREIDPAWKHISGLSSGEGIISYIRDPIIRKKVNKKTEEIEEEIEDEGVADKRAMFIESEFARTLKAMDRTGSTLSEVIKSAWDGKNLATIIKSSLTSTNPHVSILAHVTQEELIKRLHESEVFNGFGNRFTFACVRRIKPIPSPRLGDSELFAMVEKVRDAVNFAVRVEEMTRTPEAEAYWRNWYHENYKKEKFGLIGAITDRDDAHVLRRQCLYALLDKSAVVELRHIKSAIAVEEYSERSVEYIFHNISGNSLASTIYQKLLPDPNGQAREDISKYLSHHRSSDEISKALSELEESGLAKRIKESTDGRPKEIWKAVTSEESEKSTSEELNSLPSLNSHDESKAINAEKPLEPVNSSEPTTGISTAEQKILSPNIGVQEKSGDSIAQQGAEEDNAPKFGDPIPERF